MSGYTHIVLSAGGMKGLTYIGIYRYLKENKLINNVRHIIGCSCGSLFAYLYSLDLSVEYMEKLITDALSDDEIISYEVEGITASYRNKGIFDIMKLKKLLVRAFKVKYKKNISKLSLQEFSKLTGKNLYLLVFNVNKYKDEIFSSINTPDIDVFDAVLASMALPLLFKPIEINNQYYLDGGIVTTFPINYIKYSHTDKVLAIYLSKPGEVPHDKLKDPLTYLSQTLYCITSSYTAESHLPRYKEKKNIDLMILDNIKITTLSFSFKNNRVCIYLPDNTCDNAICFGYNKTYEFFKKKSIGSS